MCIWPRTRSSYVLMFEEYIQGWYKQDWTGGRRARQSYFVGPDTALIRPDAPPIGPDTALIRPDAAPIRPDAALIGPNAPLIGPDAALIGPDTPPIGPDAPPPWDGRWACRWVLVKHQWKWSVCVSGVVGGVLVEC